MSETTDAILDLRHANEFTDIENTAIVYVLRGWFGSLAAIPGAIEAGDDAWAFTTLAEHFVSLLDKDPAKRTPAHLKIRDLLLARAKEAQDAVDAVLGAENNEDERMTKETDAFVKQLVQKIGKPDKKTTDHNDKPEKKTFGKKAHEVVRMASVADGEEEKEEDEEEEEDED